jgi:hypothetical protein
LFSVKALSIKFRGVFVAKLRKKLTFFWLKVSVLK